MYYIVEITSQGIETFLAGFEDIGDAWDIVSGLQCEARRQRRKVRYEYAKESGRRDSQPHRISACSRQPIGFSERHSTCWWHRLGSHAASGTHGAQRVPASLRA